MSSDTKKFEISLAPFREKMGNVYLIQSFFSEHATASTLYLPKYVFSYSFLISKSIIPTNAILIPHPTLDRSPETLRYLNSVAELSHLHTKPVFMFMGGDLSHDIKFPEFNFHIFRGTQYKKLLQKSDIIIPPICEDLGFFHGFEPRQKSPQPLISFCGWAGFNNKKHYIKYLLKNFYIDIKKILLLDASLEVYKKGLYFRRKAIIALNSNGGRVQTSFIIRNSFSGNKRTISLSPDDARKEYIENMKNSDFVLAPKGDANYSVRFFEALSLGRIPILIDTDVCLPLEDEIDYSKFIVRVSYRDIKKLPQIISDFYSSISNEEFIEMQKKAREAFEKYLRYDSFFNRIFSDTISSEQKI